MSHEQQELAVGLALLAEEQALLAEERALRAEDEALRAGQAARAALEEARVARGESLALMPVGPPAAARSFRRELRAIRCALHRSMRGFFADHPRLFATAVRPALYLFALGLAGLSQLARPATPGD